MCKWHAVYGDGHSGDATVFTVDVAGDQADGAGTSVIWFWICARKWQSGWPPSAVDGRFPLASYSCDTRGRFLTKDTQKGRMGL